MYIKRKIKGILKKILPHFIVLKHEKNKILKQKYPTSDEPKIYNESGELFRTLFLSSSVTKQWPYGFVLGRYPRNIFWDNFNYGLNNHFYAHEKIFSQIGKPLKKFAIFVESESIVPYEYTFFDSNSSVSKDFNLIFTHSEKLLNKFGNAVFIPGGGVWYGTEKHGGAININQCNLKTKNVSIVSSDKSMCKLHDFRKELAIHYKKNNLVGTYGTFDNGKYAQLDEYLTDYRYSIVIENNVSSYWFTEKLLNCFASMTVPIYIGAKKITDFFNQDGIIQVNDISIEAIDKIIRNCNENDYFSRLNAIIDNFNRVKDFLCIEDYIFKKYGNLF